MVAGNGHAVSGIEQFEMIEAGWLTMPMPGDATSPVLGADGKPWRVLVCNSGSLAAVRAQRNLNRASQAIRQRTGAEPTDEDFHELTMRQIADWILDWTPMEREGQPFLPTAENKLWLVKHTPFGEDVNRFFGRLSNFLRTKQGNSWITADTSTPENATSLDQAEAR